MKVLMTGGGTGGHVYPALAIADTICEKEPDSNIAFVGTSHGIENKLVPAAGYPLHHVEIQGIRRSFSLSNLKTAWLVFTSVFKAKKLLRTFQPDLVVGTGGYVSWPVVKAASQMGIPTALHESNAIPGVAVKVLQDDVDLLFVCFEQSRTLLHHPQKAITVGNPMRMQPNKISYQAAREALGIAHKYRRFILSLGGSMGAEQINFCMLDLMEKHIAAHPEILHVHASGSLEYEATKALFAQKGLDRYENLKLVEYIYDMPTQMAAADIVINRSGSMTLSELALLHKPCILIPSPNVTNNHQYKNAKVLADRGGAVLIEEKDLQADSLWNCIQDLFANPMRLAQMADAMGTLAVPDSNERIYQALRALVDQKKANKNAKP